jgi:hypothetical protein
MKIRHKKKPSELTNGFPNLKKNEYESANLVIIPYQSSYSIHLNRLLLLNIL